MQSFLQSWLTPSLRVTVLQTPFVQTLIHLFLRLIVYNVSGTVPGAEGCASGEYDKVCAHPVLIF